MNNHEDDEFWKAFVINASRDMYAMVTAQLNNPDTDQHRLIRQYIEEQPLQYRSMYACTIMRQLLHQVSDTLIQLNGNPDAALNNLRTTILNFETEADQAVIVINKPNDPPPTYGTQPGTTDQP